MQTAASAGDILLLQQKARLVNRQNQHQHAREVLGHHRPLSLGRYRGTQERRNKRFRPILPRLSVVVQNLSHLAQFLVRNCVVGVQGQSKSCWISRSVVSSMSSCGGCSVFRYGESREAPAGQAPTRPCVPSAASMVSFIFDGVSRMKTVRVSQEREEFVMEKYWGYVLPRVEFDVLATFPPRSPSAVS